MPRPPKCRWVENMPETTYFKPAGVPLKNLEEINLSIEELEAIRLKDLDGLEQEECAEKMGISRPTFHRIINGARHKVAQALITGKAINIKGGNFCLVDESFLCHKCGQTWQCPTKAGQNDLRCPHCKSPNKVPMEKAGNEHRKNCSPLPRLK